MDVIRSIQPPIYLFELSQKYDRLADAFVAFHQFDELFISESSKLKECATCRNKSTFIRYRCVCPYCTEVNQEMAEEYVNEYILHCFECRRCICRIDPKNCLGCAFLECLLTADCTHLENHLVLED